MKVGSFDDDWEVDFGRSELRIRPQSFLNRLRRWRTVYRLSAFHAYAHRLQASVEGMASPTIFNSDAMKPIEGVPKKLELINGWRVPSNSLKKMVGDGYVLIGDGKLLVPDSGSKLWEAVSLKPGMFGFSIDLKKLFRR